MRHTARLLAVCYAAIVTAGPLAHAAQERPVPAAAIEGSHSQACSPGHDPATCPVAGLSRSTPSAERPATVPAPRVLRPFAVAEAIPSLRQIWHGPERSTGPPSLSVHHG